MWSPVVRTSAPALRRRSMRAGVTPEPSAMFSAFTTTRSRRRDSRRAGRCFSSTLRPGAPTTSPNAAILRRSAMSWSLARGSDEARLIAVPRPRLERNEPSRGRATQPGHSASVRRLVCRGARHDPRGAPRDQGPRDRPGRRLPPVRLRARPAEPTRRLRAERPRRRPRRGRGTARRRRGVRARAPERGPAARPDRRRLERAARGDGRGPLHHRCEPEQRPRSGPRLAGRGDLRRLPPRALRPRRPALPLPLHELHVLRPRLTIVTETPYDRAHTTMASFTM